MLGGVHLRSDPVHLPIGKEQKIKFYILKKFHKQLRPISNFQKNTVNLVISFCSNHWRFVYNKGKW